MKFISPRIHAILDYVVVAAFLAGPSVLGFTGLPAQISHTLAGVHLLLTLCTAFPGGLVKLVPLYVHAIVEFIVAIVLIPLPWALDFAAEPAVRYFYIGAGVVIILAWLLTDYKRAVGPSTIPAASA